MPRKKPVTYPEVLKQKIARKYLLGGVSYSQLIEETGASRSTIAGWIQKERPGEASMKSQKRRRAPRSAEQKLELVLRATALKDEELGSFLREAGVREGELERWKGELREQLTLARQAAGAEQKMAIMQRTLKKQEKRLHELELLVELQKKVQSLWAVVDDDTQ